MFTLGQEEFEVVSRRIQLKTSGATRIAEAGEGVVVPPGVDHVWGNPFDDSATISVAFRPALKLETFFETYFGLASDGKLDPKTQMPSFLQLVLMVHEYRDETTLPGVAGMATRGLGAALAPLARARGYRGRYAQYSDPDAP
jgi:hypothetical protein